jgi:hypothetical protein
MFVGRLFSMRTRSLSLSLVKQAQTQILLSVFGGHLISINFPLRKEEGSHAFTLKMRGNYANHWCKIPSIVME